MATIGYCRVSTQSQNLDAQLQELSGCDKVFREKISGARQDRPQLDAMLDYVREGDSVVVSKLDRLARNTKHLLEISDYLTNKGVALKILNLGIDTTTPTGKLMLTMIGAVAAFERELMKERVADGIESAKSKGTKFGRPNKVKSATNEVAKMQARGMNKKQIAKELGISVSSVYRTLKQDTLNTYEK